MIKNFYDFINENLSDEEEKRQAEKDTMEYDKTLDEEELYPDVEEDYIEDEEEEEEEEEKEELGEEE